MFIFLINLKVIEVLSLADGKVIPQGRIKYVQHLEGGIVEDILIKEGSKFAFLALFGTYKSAPYPCH